MPPDRLRSIVPMFGGATKYVETLDAILEYVVTHEPTTDDLVGWHRGTFSKVSSRDSIMRRVSYLEQVGFLEESDRWRLGRTGDEYFANGDRKTLLRIMVERNVGLRSLLYALAAGPMTIEQISDQQLDTHPELGWSRGETDMALQRANWLRSLGMIEKRDRRYVLTDAGRRYIGEAVSEWGSQEVNETPYWRAGTYDTPVQARTVDPEFRATMLTRYGRTCPVSGVDHPALLDVAHVLSWSDYPDYRADPTNVLALGKTHHAAFDRELFTIDQDYRLHVNPEFETQSSILQRTLIERHGQSVALPAGSIDGEYLARRNAEIAWL